MKSLMLCYILQVAIAVKIAPVGLENASASTRSIEKSELESISFSGIVIVIKTELATKMVVTKVITSDADACQIASI